MLLCLLGRCRPGYLCFCYRHPCKAVARMTGPDQTRSLACGWLALARSLTLPFRSGRLLAHSLARDWVYTQFGRRTMVSNVYHDSIVSQPCPLQPPPPCSSAPCILVVCLTGRGVTHGTMVQSLLPVRYTRYTYGVSCREGMFVCHGNAKADTDGVHTAHLTGRGVCA